MADGACFVYSGGTQMDVLQLHLLCVRWDMEHLAAPLLFQLKGRNDAGMEGTGAPATADGGNGR